MNLRNGGEKSPPDFCEKSEEREILIKDGCLEIRKSDYEELVARYGEHRTLYAINRYHRAFEEAGMPLSGNPKAQLLKYIGYLLENENSELQKEKRATVGYEEEVKKNIKTVFVKSNEQIEKEKKQEQERKSGEEAIRRRMEERRRLFFKGDANEQKSVENLT